MKALLIEKTRQEKIINEVQKKRNLFGLGLTSLIAACSADNAAENGATKVDHGTIPQTGLEATPLTADAVRERSNTKVTTAAPPAVKGGARDDKNDLVVSVWPSSDLVDDGSFFQATFQNGDNDADITQLSGYKGLAVAGKNDLVVSSSEFGNPAGDPAKITGAIYIFWNINEGRTITNVETEATQKFLKVAGFGGDIIAAATPKFYKDLGVEADHDDMVFRSGGNTPAAATNINILWDVTKHAADDATAGGTKLDVKSNEILQVQGGLAADPKFIKVNNNDNYDMIVKGAGATSTTYILWDVANYHNAEATAETKQAVVNLAAADAPEHGLLTIIGLTKDIMTATMGNGEVGYTDIDRNGINDLAFTDENNTYILFGEKIANMEGGKAISYAINLITAVGRQLYDKAGDEVTAPTDESKKAGFFHYDFDGEGDNSNPEVENVGYLFSAADQNKLGNLADIAKEYDKVINPTDTGSLSEEAYWDIA